MFATGLRKEYQTATIAITSTASSYGFDKLRFGGTKAGVAWESYQGVTACFETGVTDAVCELWLAKLGPAHAGTRAFADYVNDDFVYSGNTFTAAEVSETWVLAGWPCFEIRVKSGGTGGSPVIGATAL